MNIIKELSENNVILQQAWMELTLGTAINLIESGFDKEVVKEYLITEMVVNGDKVLLKWHKRIIPLEDEAKEENL